MARDARRQPPTGSTRRGVPVSDLELASDRLGGGLDDVRYGVDHLVGDPAVDFRNFADVDVLYRALRDLVEAERPARQLQLKCAHRRAQLVLVLRVAVD